MLKVGIIVCSDGCYRGERVDTSGKAIAEVVTALGYEVADLTVLPDDKDMLVSAMNNFVTADVPLVLTTGGTGFSDRDVTPEATKEVIEKEAPGIAEAIRQKSLAITDRAMLSRAVAGIKNHTLIINLPGSEKAVREALDVIMNAVGHGLDILLGTAHDCARK